MFKGTAVILLAFATLAGSPLVSMSQEARPDPSIRVSLEGAFESWRTALAQNDLKKWEETTAFSRQIEIRNRIVSAGLPFPQALFEDPVLAPSLGGLVSLGVLSTGVTATSTYFGRANFGGEQADVRDNLLVLHFLNEEGRWRFDNLRIVKVAHDAEVLLQIRNGDFSFLTGDEFLPAPQLPPVPQPVSPPEYLAEAWIDSTGYELTISVNGHPMGKFANIKGSELVIGGLKRGQNTISLTCQRLESFTGSAKLEVAIYAAKEAGKQADRVFHFRPGSDVPPTLHEQFFVE